MVTLLFVQWNGDSGQAVVRYSYCMQVERKFVMLTLGRSGVLAAMDPHAADERVRLEQLQVKLFTCDLVSYVAGLRGIAT